MPKLSAFLITKNEAQDLAACLESLRGLADEIVVVDDESSDETMAIARRFTDRIYTRRLDGFGAQKQFALEKTTGEWAFSIDADERVTPALREEILRVLQSPSAEGYQIRRRVFFLGTPLRFGGMGSDWVLRLFRRVAGRFTPVRVHERVQVEGRVLRLGAPLDHYTYRSMQEYVEKCNFYTQWAAEEQRAVGRRFHAWSHLRPGWEFLSRYILKGGFLDGQAGLIYAGLSAHAAWLRALKLKELNGRAPHLNPLPRGGEEVQKIPLPWRERARP